MLSEQHRRTLMVDSAIPLQLVEERSYRTITDAKELLAIGFADYQARTVPGLLVPIWGPTGSEPVSYQFRPDKPRTKNGKPVKYESLPNVGPRLDVPPCVRARIGDPKDTLWITEGAKKADAAAAKGLACVDVTGVWNFKGKNAEGGSVVIGDLDHVALKGRQVVICFDSDVMEKPALHSALQRLGGVSEVEGREGRIRDSAGGTGREDRARRLLGWWGNGRAARGVA